jgi:methyl-accepting chemotaxis protein
VVAGEVRKLAERSQRETRQIGELIRTIQRETRETAKQILSDAESAKRERERADAASAGLIDLISAVDAAARQADGIAGAAQSAKAHAHVLGDLIEPVRLVAEANAEATHEMAVQMETVAEAMGGARADTEALGDTAEHLRRLIAHFRLTEARREAVSIAVSVRSAAWPGVRRARIVDMSATGARIDGLAVPEGTDLQLVFNSIQRRARVMRSADGDGGPWVGVAFIDRQRPVVAAA